MKKPNLEISKVVTRADWLSARLELDHHDRFRKGDFYARDRLSVSASIALTGRRGRGDHLAYLHLNRASSRQLCMKSGNARLVSLHVWDTGPSAGIRARVARRDAGVARARIEPERLVRLIRGVWHCSAVAWAGVAVLLIVARWMASQMGRHRIVGTARHRPSTGPLPAAISMPFWPKLTSNGWRRQLDKIRHRNFECGY